MACVVAMITGDELEEVFEVLGHDGSERHFRFLDCAAYLNRHGFHLGAYARPVKWCKEYTKFEYHTNQPALVIVVGRGGGPHAIFYTGEMVIDPSPDNMGRKLSEYQILECWPITRYED
jgi:hypothetical protein